MKLSVTTRSVSLWAGRVVRSTTLLCYLSILCLQVAALERAADAAEPAETFASSVPIATGFVIIDGEYISPPYVIEQHGTTLMVNGHTLSSGLASQSPTLQPANWRSDAVETRLDSDVKERGRRGPSSNRRRKSGKTRGNTPLKTSKRLDDAASELSRCSLLVTTENGYMGVYARPKVASVLSALLSDEPFETKLSQLDEQRGHGSLSRDQWPSVVTRFQSSPELQKRATLLFEQERIAAEADRDASSRAQWYQLLAIGPVQYTITLLAMVLAVGALGNLMQYPPEKRGRWRDVHDNGDVIRHTPRIVIILGLLGCFDLVLTLLAQKTGGFMELNPLGSQIVTNPLLLAAFKMSSLALACWILLRLRSYHGAQVAAWWLCMVCTVLTFRWVTFNSLFIS